MLSNRSSWVVLVAFALLGGCAADSTSDRPSVQIREPMLLASGAEQTQRLCHRGRSDRVLDVFCNSPSVTSLVELRAALGLSSNDNDIYRGFALVGHSTSLSLRGVSAINPRIIFVGPHADQDEPLFLAFVRGEQAAEIVARDVHGELQFYLLTFSQDCNQAAAGCTPGDLLTEVIESGWNDVNVYAEEDLLNTPRDCRVCHQPDGPQSPKLLRMQEIEPPWNHWFWRQATGGHALIDDYYAAKGNEPFAGLPGAAIVTSQPGLLSAALFSSHSQTQPNAFVSARIEQEVRQSAEAAGGNQPNDNSVPGQSATWDAIYERAKRGEAITVPYHDVKVTDPAKLERMTQAYVEYRNGVLARNDLPDLRDIYPDDELLRAHMGLVTEPGLDGQGVLLQACAQCHRAGLDEGLSRARFRADLSKLDRATKDRAIARLSLPADHPSAMPPAVARALTKEARAKLVELLQR
jgi:hypothetical protein